MTPVPPEPKRSLAVKLLGTADAKLRVLLVLSFVGWSAYIFNQPRPSPLADLSRGWYSDHFSHLNGARAFVFGHVNIWTTPLIDAFVPLTPRERSALPEDLRSAAGQPASEAYVLPGSLFTKPIVASWSRLIRPYPPGDVLAVLPVAAVYQWTALSFSGACRGLIWLFVLYVHLAMFFAARTALAMKPMAVVSVLLLYVDSMQWALNGFYDGAALVPLSIAALCAQRKQWLNALLAYTVAAFVHYRAFFFAPWAIYFAIQFLLERRTFRLARGEWLRVVGITFFSVCALGTFAWVWPQLDSFPLGNPVHYSTFPPNAVGLAATAILAAVVFAFAGAWMDVVVTAWVMLMVFTVRQTFAWHAVLLFPWVILPLPGKDPSKDGMAQHARLVLVIAIGAIVLGNTFLPSWLAQLP